MKIYESLKLLTLVVMTASCATMKIGEYEKSEVREDIAKLEKSLREWKATESAVLVNKYKGLPQCYNQIAGIQLTNNSPECKSATERFVTNLNVVADISLAKTVFKNGIHPNIVMQNFDENFEPNLVSMFVRIPGQFHIPINKMKNYDLKKYISYSDALAEAADKECRIFGTGRKKQGECRYIDRGLQSLSKKRKNLEQILAKIDGIMTKRKAYVQSPEGKKNRRSCEKDIRLMKPVLHEYLGMVENIKEALYVGDKSMQRRLNRKVKALNLKIKKGNYQMLKHKCEQFDDLSGKKEVAETMEEIKKQLTH